MMHTAPGPRPKESVFYEPMVYLLGKLTGFKPYVGVPHEAIQDDVLRLAGLTPTIIYGEGEDPESAVSVAVDEEGNAWPLKSKSSQDRNGLYRVVHFAWYHQTRQYRPDCEGKVFCAKPMLPELDRLEEKLDRMLGITQTEASILRDPKAPAKDKQKIRAKKKRNTAKLSARRRDSFDELKAKIKEINSRGEWALTELGVRKARELKEKYEGKIVLSAGPNATARFLGDNWDRLYERMTQHLRRKMPRSEELGKIDDHAMNWIERAIQRDSLRGRIEAGKSIPPSQVQAWARKGAYTDIRNEGREPVSRVFHGALTKKEIAMYDPSNWTEVVIPRSINESENLSVNAFTEHSEDDYVSERINNLRDDHAMADVEGTVMNENSFQDVLSRVSEIIHDEIDPTLDPEFHQQLMVERFVKEMTIREIAEAHGIDDERQVTVSLNRVRDVMLRAREEGDFDDVILR
jgi:hypothetical protein